MRKVLFLLLPMAFSAPLILLQPGCGPGGDLYEPNDTQATATQVVLPFNDVALSIDHASDEDFYEFTLTDPADVRVLVTFLDIDGDVDVRVLGADSAQLASSSSATDNEDLTVSLDAGTYTVRVFTFGLNATNDYELRIEAL